MSCSVRADSYAVRSCIPGQWKFLDVVDADDLSNAEATEVL